VLADLRDRALQADEPLADLLQGRRGRALDRGVIRGAASEELAHPLRGAAAAFCRSSGAVHRGVLGVLAVRQIGLLGGLALLLTRAGALGGCSVHDRIGGGGGRVRFGSRPAGDAPGLVGDGCLPAAPGVAVAAVAARHVAVGPVAVVAGLPVVAVAAIDRLLAHLHCVVVGARLVHDAPPGRE
jgi:hypothetical protein